MIIGVIYNKVANNATGEMGCTERRVGAKYLIYDRILECKKITSGLDPLTREAIIAISFEGGVEHVIPYKGAEIFYEELREDNEAGTSEDVDTLRG